MTKKIEVTPPEERDADETAEEETETQTNDGNEDSQDDLENNNQPDYEALLVQERERREKAEKALAQKSFKSREQRREKKEDEEEEDDDDKPLTRKELSDVLREERAEARKETQQFAVAEQARKLAKSDAEAEYIVEIHRSRTFPEGMSLPEQLAEAQAIASYRALQAENSELRRSAAGKKNVNHSSARSEQDPPESFTSGGKDTVHHGKDIAAITAAGYVWDGKKGVYLKNIGKDKTLVYNPKTKKQEVRSRS